MSHNDILYPVAAQILLIAITAIIAIKRRRDAVKAGKLKVSRFRLMDLSGLEERYVTPGNNYNNQFQVPMLFMLFVLFSLQLQLVDSFFIGASWLFVVSRVAHTAIHVTYNHVLHRLLMFIIGFFTILICWVRLVILATT